ncbi:hypothetical protein [Streptomyces flavidovirens]|uniref:Uncharacterized protein n=1 Tax=Streptomyces flavidovirens TaxID=67298 RepID=A0ABW6RQC6_9ACTN
MRQRVPPTRAPGREGNPLVDELVESAADHYALNYSKHPVPVLFREVRAARALLARLLTPAGSALTCSHRAYGPGHSAQHR